MNNVELLTIRPISDNEFINSLIKITKQLVDNSGKYGTMAYAKSDDGKRAYDELSTLLTNRFGIPFSCVASIDPAWIVAMDSLIANSMGDGAIGKLIAFKQREEAALVKYRGTKVGTTYVSSNPKDNKKFLKKVFSGEISSTSKELAKGLQNSIKELNRILNTGNVKVDIKKAKIKGLVENNNGNLDVVIGINPEYFISNDDSEYVCAAIILHEVGHQFNAVLESIKLITGPYSIYESIINERTEDSIKIAVKKLLKEDVNADVATIELLKKIQQDNMKLLGVSRNGGFNNESSADRFVARFGLSKYLVAGLHNDNSRQKGASSYYKAAFILLGINIGLTSIAGMISIQLIGITLVPLIMTIIISILALMNVDPNYISLDNPHENYYDRVRKIKLDLIRQIRLYYDDTPYFGDILHQIDYLDKTLEESKMDKKLANLFITYLFGDSKSVAKHELFERLEQITENDIHTSVLRLKKLTTRMGQ